MSPTQRCGLFLLVVSVAAVVALYLQAAITDATDLTPSTIPGPVIYEEEP